MQCKNLEECKQKYLKLKQMRDKSIQSGEEIFEGIIQSIEEGIDIPFSDHGDKRSLFRAFSIYEIREAILNGWVIEYDNKRKTILVLYNFKVAIGTYRPIHVVIGLSGKVKIITCYDPRSKEWKWDRSYQERICFCKD